MNMMPGEGPLKPWWTHGFEGLTPAEVEGLIYRPFDPEVSPLVFAPVPGDVLEAGAPFLKDALTYLRRIRELEPLKLTQKGNLPRNLCREFVDLDIFDEGLDREHYERFPVMREEEVMYIHVLNVVTRISGLTRKRHGKLHLTKRGAGFLNPESRQDLYEHLFMRYARKFNWVYSDLYPDSPIIQRSFGLSIYMVKMYGGAPRNLAFYADKFLEVFPLALDEFPPDDLNDSMEYFRRGYFLRVFERFMKRFGLITIEGVRTVYEENCRISKTDLMDRLIVERAPPSAYAG